VSFKIITFLLEAWPCTAMQSCGPGRDAAGQVPLREMEMPTLSKRSARLSCDTRHHEDPSSSKNDTIISSRYRRVGVLHHSWIAPLCLRRLWVFRFLVQS